MIIFKMKRIRRLELDLKQEMETNLALHDDIRELRADKQVLMESITKLNDSKVTLNEDIADLKIRVEDLKDQLNKKNEKLKAANKKIKELKSK